MSDQKRRILVIDDETSIRRFLKVALASHGYEVLEAVNGLEGLSSAANLRPDLIILDLGLPDLPGIKVLHQLREWYQQPIIILSVRDDEESVVEALDGGADDYLTKPFGLGEMLARIRLVCRRTQVASDPAIVVGDLSVDLANRIVTRRGQEIKLTTTEFALLAFMIRNSGKVLTHEQVLKQVWGPNAGQHRQYLRVYVGHLRQKIEDDPSRPKLIVTIPGVGYRIA